VSVAVLRFFKGIFGGLKGFAYFWSDKNTKPIGLLPMGFVLFNRLRFLLWPVGAKPKIF
jgi:hypothetical protein